MGLSLGLLLFSSSARADTGLKIVVDRCNDVDADEIGRIVLVEFREANEGKSTITIACVNHVATLRMLEAGTTKELYRSVDLSAVDPIARPRTLALLVGELLDPNEVSPEEAHARGPGASAALRQVEVAPPPPVPRPTLRQPTLSLGLSLGFGGRNFDYEVPAGVTDAVNLRPYNAPLAPMARLEGRAYPFSKSSEAAGLGISGQYAQATTHLSHSSDGMSVNSRRREWDLNLRYQQVLSFTNIAAEVGRGHQRFAFSADSPDSSTLLSELASVGIDYTRFALDADLALTPYVGITLGLEYRLVADVGALDEKFSATHVSAWATDFGVHYWITDSIRTQASYTRSSFAYKFKDSAGATQAVGQDTFDALLLGLRFQH